MSSHFFQPPLATRRNPGQTPLSVFGSILDVLVVRPGMPVTVGLWGASDGGFPLEIRAYRGPVWVNQSPSSPVKFTRTLNDPAQKLQEFTVTGLRDGDTLVGVSPSGKPLTDSLPVYELRDTASGLMKQAAANDEYRHSLFRGICPYAVPYLAVRDSTFGDMTALDDRRVGGPLMNIHGLAVHTTAGNDVRSTYQMARWGCVETWNTRWASAHFGVAGDGTLVQFIPTTFIAVAQYSPGNEYWLSVEVDNDGKTPMKAKQVAAVQKLFRWIVDTYGVARQVATGCLFAEETKFDKVTTEVCDRGDVDITTDPYVACMSSGLSCHWWLESKKTSDSHHCPGKGIMNQLDEIAHG